MTFESPVIWSFQYLVLLTLLAAVTVITLASAGFYLSVRFPSHRVAGHVATAVVTIAVSILFSVSLHQLWGAKRDEDQRMWTARSQHLQRLQHLLRTESDYLKGIAQALREGRYLTLVADDARKAVWQDDPLTTDVERHFPEYYRERERLIRDVLEHDSILGQVRQIVSGTLQLTEATEPYRSDLVRALVNKCGGAAQGISFVRLADNSSPMADAVRVYEQYRCTVDLTRMSQGLFDRATDLAEAASLASEAARRYAEETVLHGSCTYAPAE